jgi:hypothetical protein
MLDGFMCNSCDTPGTQAMKDQPAASTCEANVKQLLLVIGFNA